MIVTERDVLCDGGDDVLFDDPCGPVAAFFWAAAAVQAPEPSCGRLAGLGRGRCVWSESIRPKLPAVSAFEISRVGGKKTMAITVRGTVSFKDVKKDLTVASTQTRAAFERKARAAAANWPEAAAAVEADLVESTRSRMAFHQGFYVLAARVLGPVLQAIRRRRPRRVVFYGHSLGAAVASFLYRWVKAVEASCRLAVMSCPAICDEACFRRWFEPLGDDGDAARHYYTSGDLVVGGVPGLTVLTRRATIAGEYEGAPDPAVAAASSAWVAKGRAWVAARLLSHLTLTPGTLRRASDGAPLVASRRVPSGAVLSFSDAKVSSVARRWLGVGV